MPEEEKHSELVRILRRIEERMGAFETKLEQLQKRVEKLGNGCGEAFRQVKTVVEHLTTAVDDTRQELSLYGGYITKSTWDTEPFV